MSKHSPSPVPYVLPVALWRTPPKWGPDEFFCTWPEIAAIAEKMKADPYEAEQYVLIGADQRAVNRGWYQRATFGMADGKTLWALHCVELNANRLVIRQAAICESKPACITDKDERLMLMRCLRNA